jgi:uncharacterized membrane protein YeiH
MHVLQRSKRDDHERILLAETEVAHVAIVQSYVATKLRFPSTLAAVLGGFVCFSLRVVSVWQHWSLPKAIGS